MISALLSLFILPLPVEAKLCPPDKVTSTMYYVPNVITICGGCSPCAEFKRAVDHPKYGAGTGSLCGGKVYRYTGKTEEMSVPGCPTAVGAGGVCLTPFISLAADMNHYLIGDIIEIPALRGKMIKMPDGKVIRHPGLLIVEDTGSAIQGANRFDFFTGGFGQFDRRNEFGSHSPSNISLADERKCEDHKKYRRLPAAAHGAALAAIERFKEEAGIPSPDRPNLNLRNVPTPTWRPDPGEASGGAK